MKTTYLEATKLVLCDIWRKGDRKTTSNTDEYILLYDEDGKSFQENIAATKFAQNVYKELTETHNYSREKAIKFISEAAMRAGDDLRTTRFFRYSVINSHVLRLDAILEPNEMPEPKIEKHHNLRKLFLEAWKDVWK